MKRTLRVLVAASLMAIGMVAGGVGVTGAAASRDALVPGTWSVVSSPNSAMDDNVLHSISCPTATFCMAVGFSDDDTGEVTLAEQWNGVSWSIDPTPTLISPTLSHLASVSCPTTTFCVATGTAVNGPSINNLIEQWNGTAWSVAPGATVPSAEGLAAVSCSSVSFCTAVGWNDATPSKSVAESWNGTTWALQTTATPSPSSSDTLAGITCKSVVFCMAVGSTDNGVSTEPLVEQWTGASWTVSPTPSQPTTTSYVLDSVSCPSTTYCEAVGSGNGTNLVEQLNGTVWTVQTTPVPSGDHADLDSVSCVGISLCVAVGLVGTAESSTLSIHIPQIQAWNGTTWVQQTADNPPTTPTNDNYDSLYGVSCVGGQACIAAGGYRPDLSEVVVNTLIESASISRPGYRLVARDGGNFTFGGASYQGSTGGIHLNQPIVGMAATPDGGGYWLVAADGGIFSFGDAKYFGSTGAITLNKPIVGMSGTPDGGGYWLVASDGGVFSFGDAAFYGSTGNITLNKPIVDIAGSPTGKGYWMVASDGGVFSFGDTRYWGSTGNITLNEPITGMAATRTGLGYWMVASDGGIFAFGDASFHGSASALPLNNSIVGIAGTPSNNGYWLVSSSGGIFCYGDATFHGSTGAIILNYPIVGVAA